MIILRATGFSHGPLKFRKCGRHPGRRFAIRLSNCQDAVVAENNRTRVEAASQLYDVPQFSVMRNAETSRIPNPIRDGTWRRTEEIAPSVG
jgi:hypothetical protein